jgi:glycosyltransferase involved in cell wall biosynthesis
MSLWLNSTDIFGNCATAPSSHDLIANSLCADSALRPLKLWFISNVFPSPYHPTRGTFNLEFVRALARHHIVRVIAPVAWVDELRSRALGNFVCPGWRQRKQDGFLVYHPRYYYTPLILRTWYGSYFWHSVRPTVNHLFETERPDGVLGYWAHPDGEAAIRIAREAGVPAVVMVGGSDVLILTQDEKRRQRVLNVLYDADAVIAVSRHIKTKLIAQGIPAAKIHVVYRGVDGKFAPGDASAARRHLGIPDTTPVLLWVGRMVPVKGLDVLLEASQIIQERGVDYHLYLLGDGPLRSTLVAQCRALNLTKNVTFVGPVEHERLPDWYRGANLTVLSSHSEGVPNVLLESLASGTPFVATRVGGIAEIAQGQPTRLVPPGNSPALAEAIMEALQAPPTSTEVWFQPCSCQESAAAVCRIFESLSDAPRKKRNEPMSSPGMRSTIRQLGLSAMKATLPRKRFIVSGPSQSRAVCLTFDDGPHPEYTPRLLDVLKECGVQATFFVVGRNAENYPDLVRRIAAEGHALGNHSYAHSEPRHTSARRLMGEIQQTAVLLASLANRAIGLFRPPKGHLTLRKLWGSWRLNQTIVLWNVDPKDYRCQSADEVRSWFDRRPLRGGDIVLMHDSVPHAMQVVGDLIRTARTDGLHFVTIPEWAK